MEIEETEMKLSPLTSGRKDRDYKDSVKLKSDRPNALTYNRIYIIDDKVLICRGLFK